MDLHIRDVLKKYIKQDQRVGDAYYAQKIRDFWEQHLGSSITSRTTSISFIRGKLSVSVNSAPLRHELFNNRDTLKERINTYLNEDIVLFIDLT